MKINDVLAQVEYNQVQSKRLVTNGEQQVNILSFAKGAEIPAHTSAKDATIVVLEGEVCFSISGKDYTLKCNDTFSFGKDADHSFKALADAKFLLIQ